jgi:hypothetical protein
MRRPIRRLAGLALLLLASRVAADAPRDQYAPFTGSSKDITDRFTELTWDRTAKKAAYTIAVGDCVGVGKRIPTLKELLTLVDEDPRQEYENGAIFNKPIDTNAFPHNPPDFFFSSTPVQDKAATRVWGVDFRTGATTDLQQTEPAYYRCVK